MKYRENKKGENKRERFLFFPRWQYAILKPEEEIQDDRFLDGQQTFYFHLDPAWKEKDCIALRMREEGELCSNSRLFMLENGKRISRIA